MVEVLHRLALDHDNMRKLLDLVEREFAAYRAGGALDFELLGSILDYVLDYPDLFHHPKEDLVYRRMREANADAAAQLGDLIGEHEKLAALTRRFADAVKGIRDNAELPKDRVEKLARDYLASTRAHMEQEEKRFFPLALKVLTLRDWQEIDAAIAAPADPVFGAKAGEPYLALHERIMRLGA